MTALRRLRMLLLEDCRHDCRLIHHNYGLDLRMVLVTGSLGDGAAEQIGASPAGPRDLGDTRVALGGRTGSRRPAIGRIPAPPGFQAARHQDPAGRRRSGPPAVPRLGARRASVCGTRSREPGFSSEAGGRGGVRSAHQRHRAARRFRPGPDAGDSADVRFPRGSPSVGSAPRTTFDGATRGRGLLPTCLNRSGSRPLRRRSATSWRQACRARRLADP